MATGVAELRAETAPKGGVKVDPVTGLKEYFFRCKQVPRLHWTEATADHLMTQEEPVVLLGTDLVASALHWDLPYLLQNLGSAKHTVYVSKTRDFKYFDDRKLKNYPEFQETMKKKEWTFSRFLDELNSHRSRKDEFLYYQNALNDTVGNNIKRDFMLFNWKWANERKKRYNWGPLTSNLLLISQPGNRTPCHYDEQHNFLCQVRGKKRCVLFDPADFQKLYPHPEAHPCDRQSQVDFDAPDFEKYPQLKGVFGYECILQPGEVLYIPMYWWHMIDSLPKEDVSISVTFWYKGGSLPSKITYPLTPQQKVAITRNIEKMLNEALQDPKEVGHLLHMIVDGRY